jgi:hypothetical protein
MSDTLKRINHVMSHIRHVQENCRIVATYMIEEGRDEMARHVIANSLHHDGSKLADDLEFEMLSHTSTDGLDKERLTKAIKQHSNDNAHHPEFWGSIHNMDEIHVIEMVCDWKARASEFGTDLIAYIHNHATVKYGFTVDDPVYAMIMKYVHILCPPKFN